MELTKETIDELKAKHGQLLRANGPSGPLLFRPPTRVEFERFVDEVANDRKSKAIAMRALCTSCFVWPPDASICAAAFEDKPGLPSTVATELGKLVGAGDAEEVAKL